MIGDTAGDYVTQTRVLLQDQTIPYRYADTEILAAVNLAMAECFRLRPDFFYGQTTVPQVTALTTSLSSLPTNYRLPVLHFVAGYTELRDSEASEETRAASMLASFAAKLTGAQVPGV